MNAIEIKNLSKSFRGLYAVDGLNMHVPVGAIYGFIGENGSGKSTTEKIICGLLHASGGEIKLFNRPHTDEAARAKLGVLIETPGCFPGCTVWNNLKLQAANLGLANADEEIRKILKTVRMEGAAGICLAIPVLIFAMTQMMAGSVSVDPQTGVSFDRGGVSVGGIVACVFAKIFLVSTFVPMYVLAACVAKRRLWLSLLLSLGIGMLTFMMIPMLTPLDSTIVNVLACLVGGVAFGFGLGFVSERVLSKTALV